jgi:hypothetical protein
MTKRIDMTGNKYGRLIVVGYSGTNNKGKALWECLCDCGNTNIVIGENLRQGVTTSCGCYRKEVEKIASVTHGLTKTNNKVNRLYSIWLDMKKRCHNPQNKEYKNYGGRGITVYGEWATDYVAFHKWAINNGYTDKLTLDRIDVNKGYSPENCKWSTWVEQGRNKRLSPKNTSGVSGVAYKKQRGLYVARIGVNGKRIFIGEYKSFNEAVNARKEAELKYWG